MSLRQLLTGKPLVINAWASWCDHCAEETGAFVRLAEAYHGRLQVVFINMTASDSWTDARAFARRHGMTGLVLADPHGTFMDRYGILVLPTTFLISPEGTVCAVKQGAMTYPEMARFVAPALSTTRNKPVAPGKADRPTGPSR